MEKTLSQMVNPYIGTISQLLKSTRPEAFLPHCPAKICPVYKQGSTSDFFCSEVVTGFPIGTSTIMPSNNEAGQPDDFYNTIDHSLEEAHPYGNVIEFENNDIKAEATITANGYAYRFTGARSVCIQTHTKVSEITVEGNEIRIYCEDEAVLNQNQLPIEYIYMFTSSPFKVAKKDESFVILTFSEDSIEFFGTLSYISNEKAYEIFLNEFGSKNFDDIYKAAYDVWERQLSLIKVTGNTVEKQTAFYTALYRSFQRMTNYAEYGHYYSSYDDSVHTGDDFYCFDNTWDTFRCMHPLQLMLEPGRQKKILESYIEMYKQSGLMPSVPGVNGDQPKMIGFHAAVLFADAMSKGIELDYETAYEGIYKNAMEQSMLPWVSNTPLTGLDRFYLENGYFPALKKDEEEYVKEVHPFERRQAVSVTLEHAYDDWCVARLAQKLGKKADYELFMKRSKNYRLLYNSETGFMAPRDINGEWVEDFDPKFGGGQGGRDYFAENNSWIYTWSVFHDIEGLSQLVGGRDIMLDRLDSLFSEGFLSNTRRGVKHIFLEQFPDATGLMGMYCMGNEPSFHIPYLYNYCGAPWKAQKRLRDVMNIWFTDKPTGMCGDEDGGAMSSWFVFSAMGFYPVCPGRAEYLIGTPIFDSIEISLENGRTFCISAEGAGSGRNYIQSAELNGEPLNKPLLMHKDIETGGSLVLHMGRKPNKEWGAGFSSVSR